MREERVGKAVFLDLHTMLEPSGEKRTLNAAAQVERATVDGAAAALLLLHSARMILSEVLAARPSLAC